MSATHFWLDEVDTLTAPVITERVLKKSMPQCNSANAWADLLSIHVDRYDFDSTELVAIFLAQIGHESADLNVLEENLNYSVEGLLSVFGRHRISVGQAKTVGRAPGQSADKRGIANILYGGKWGRKALGNIEANDGWDYRGSGILQLTGRGNFEACAADTGLDIVRNPDWVRTDKEVAVRTALWFWDNRVSGETLKRTTKQINGGFNGLPDRTARFHRTLRALKGEF